MYEVLALAEGAISRSDLPRSDWINLVTTNPVHELQETADEFYTEKLHEFVRHVEKGMRVAQQADSSWER